MTEKWEYLFCKVNADAGDARVTEALNKLGQEGWELVAVADCSRGLSTSWQSTYFKRRAAGQSGDK